MNNEEKTIKKYMKAKRGVEGLVEKYGSYDELLKRRRQYRKEFRSEYSEIKKRIEKDITAYKRYQKFMNNNSHLQDNFTINEEFHYVSDESISIPNNNNDIIENQSLNFEMGKFIVFYNNYYYHHYYSMLINYYYLRIGINYFY